jgi:hypothetical protein
MARFFSADSLFCLPNDPGLLGSFNHHEEKFDLVARLAAIHGRMVHRDRRQAQPADSASGAAAYRSQARLQL